MLSSYKLQIIFPGHCLYCFPNIAFRNKTLCQMQDTLARSLIKFVGSDMFCKHFPILHWKNLQSQLQFMHHSSSFQFAIFLAVRFVMTICCSQCIEIPVGSTTRVEPVTYLLPNSFIYTFGTPRKENVPFPINAWERLTTQLYIHVPILGNPSFTHDKITSSQ